ncbi:hypothetical protein FRC0156_00582 [Corynebacterium diphtheriae]|nr:hypothetical protein FRC0156_00582 [Corynebacterium diphtheriae]
MQPTRKSWKNMTVGSVERPEKHSYPQPHITGSTRRRGRRNLGVFINIGGIFMNTTACFAHTDMNESVRLFVCGGGLGLQVVRESVGVSHG